jgi:hypothetical protein
VKLLLDEGADPTLKNQLGMTALDFAGRGGPKEAAEMLRAATKAWKEKNGK